MITDILQETIQERELYMSRLRGYLGTNVVKVITGMRRVGKSSLLKCLIQDIVRSDTLPSNNIFYINKENLEFDAIRNYNDLYIEFKSFLENIDGNNARIFVGIDEIQEIDGWEKFVNSILSTYQERIDIYITGSNSNMLSSEISTLITGRYVELEIYPLSYFEYVSFSGEEASKELFLEYLRFGGLPGIFGLRRDEKMVFEYLRGVYATILLKDIVAHFGLRNIDFFENLYKYVFASIGNIFSAKNISDYLKSQKIKISTETVLNYLDYGLRVYMLHLVKSVDPNTKKFFEIYNKYYVGDLGLRNSLVGFDFRRDIGNILENYVYLLLRRKGYSIKIGRLENGKEVDFVAEKDGIIKYFQVCYLLGSEDTINREYSALEGLGDNWEKYIVSFDDADFGVSKGIRHVKVMELEGVV